MKLAHPQVIGSLLVAVMVTAILWIRGWPVLSHK
jgi:hypothetical protein